jgi:hypothetical protein
LANSFDTFFNCLDFFMDLNSVFSIESI